MTNQANHFVRLQSLGISLEIIKESNLSEAADEFLYPLLKPAMNALQGLKIDASWQLQLLAGNWNILSISRIKEQTDNLGAYISHYVAWAGNIKALEWIKKNQYHLLTCKDKINRNISHYAAWADRIDVIQWIKENVPVLLNPENQSQTNIAHHAAWSDDTKTLQWLLKNYPQFLLESELNHYTIVHYGICSGSTVVLDWIKEKEPQLFIEKKTCEITIANFATYSASTAELQWLKENYPNLLNVKDSHQRTIAHNAAWKGNIEMLQWIKTNNPRLLTYYTKKGKNIATYAALSGNPDALLWVKDNYPQLIRVNAELNKDVIFYAIQSNKPEQVNTALSLSKTPREIDLKYYDSSAVDIISKALDTNFTLTNIKNLPTNPFYKGAFGPLEGKVYYRLDIINKITRNAEIEKFTEKFKWFILSHYRDNSPTDLFTWEILLEIFKQGLPANIPSSIISHVFNKIVRNLHPQTIKDSILKKSLITLIEKEQSYLKIFFAGDKINILSLLKQQLQQGDSRSELIEIITSFYKEHEEIILQKKSNITFFNRFSLQEIFEKIFDLLNNHQSKLDLNDKREDSFAVGAS